MNSCRYHNLPCCTLHCGSSTVTISLVFALEMTPFCSRHRDRRGGEDQCCCDQFAVAISKIPAQRLPSHPGANQIPIAWHINDTPQTTVAVSFSALC
jgi:hypothetical protein